MYVHTISISLKSISNSLLLLLFLSGTDVCVSFCFRGVIVRIEQCSHPIVMKGLCAECGQDLTQ